MASWRPSWRRSHDTFDRGEMYQILAMAATADVSSCTPDVRELHKRVKQLVHFQDNGRINVDPFEIRSR